LSGRPGGKCGVALVAGCPAAVRAGPLLVTLKGSLTSPGGEVKLPVGRVIR